MRWIAMVAALVALAACGENTPTESDISSGAGGLEEIEWVLTDGVPLIEGYPITLRIADGEVGGTAACNSYSGAVVVTGEAFEVGDIARTEMGCPAPGVHDSESAYLQALQAVQRYEHTEGQLLLVGPDVELRFAAPPPVEDAPLTGTVWQLESLVTGSGPEGTASSTVADATLRLDDDGTLTASDGCNEMDGRWEFEDDGVLRVAEMATTDVACPPLEQQTEHIRDVLLDNPTVTLDGRRLLLTAGDRALDYRAP